MTRGARRASLVRTSSPVLVGRGGELTAMLATVTSKSTVVMIEGEAGVGKTRLVHELLAHPRVALRHAMIGHCHPLREPFPFGAVIEALRSLAGRPRPALSPVGGALRPLLPELDDMLPPSPDPIGDPHAERHRTLRATRELPSAVGPALLVVEDLHWADDSTRQMLRFVMSDPPPNLSVIVTYRREDLAGDLPVGAAYRPPDHVAGVLLQLKPLAVAQVRELAAAILDDDSVPAKFAERLRERTAGIPFVVEELLRTLRSGDRLFDTPFDHVEVPVLLRDAMADRLAGLPRTAQRLVHAAAVLGAAARVDQLAAVAGVDADAAADALGTAVESGVLFELEPTRYGFRHTLAQQAVYDTLTGPARQALHVPARQAGLRRRVVATRTGRRPVGGPGAHQPGDRRGPVPVPGTGATTTHNYPNQQSNYTAQLTVTDRAGNKNTASKADPVLELRHTSLLLQPVTHPLNGAFETPTRKRRSVDNLSPWTPPRAKSPPGTNSNR